MRKNKLIFALIASLILVGCEGYQLGGPFAQKPAGYKGGSMCKKERPLQVEYAPQQYMTVPVCPMNEVDLTNPQIFKSDGYYSEVEIAKTEGLYEPFGVVDEEEVRDVEQIKPIKLKEKPAEWDVDPNDIEGDFPEIFDNKHNANQIIMQNLESRILAFCRGTQEAIDVCVERLSCIGYEKITNVPRVTAKYDLAPNKGYPARRWREGESVPRW